MPVREHHLRLFSFFDGEVSSPDLDADPHAPGAAHKYDEDDACGDRNDPRGAPLQLDLTDGCAGPGGADDRGQGPDQENGKDAHELSLLGAKVDTRVVDRWGPQEDPSPLGHVVETSPVHVGHIEERDLIPQRIKRNLGRDDKVKSNVIIVSFIIINSFFFFFTCRELMLPLISPERGKEWWKRFRRHFLRSKLEGEGPGRCALD